MDFTCRFWGPNIGIAEDPVTGSAFCGLAPYWKKALGRKGGEEMIGYQASARGGVVRAACVKHKAAFGGEDETRVHIRGRAVSVMKGRSSATGSPPTKRSVDTLGKASGERDVRGERSRAVGIDGVGGGVASV